MTACPACGARLKLGKTRHLADGKLERRRDCRTCGYADVARYAPEVLLSTHSVTKRKVRVRTPVEQSQPHDRGTSAGAA